MSFSEGSVGMRSLFELYYQEEFMKMKKPHMYSLEGRLKWDSGRGRYYNPETQKAYDWFVQGFKV